MNSQYVFTLWVHARCFLNLWIGYKLTTLLVLNVVIMYYVSAVIPDMRNSRDGTVRDFG